MKATEQGDSPTGVYEDDVGASWKAAFLLHSQ